jgi:poly(3-hydroxybutyrate) depolymerase
MLVDLTLGSLSSGCGKSPTFTNGSSNTLTVNSKSRNYLVTLPTNYDKNNPYRLVFLLHPMSVTAEQVASGLGGYLPYFGLPPVMNNSAIIVAPNGLNKAWNNQGGEDIALIDAITQVVEADLCINQSLRFSVGMSFGGAMTYALACARAKVFRAVAVLSGGTMSGCDGGSDPIAYYGQHGVRDTTLPIANGRALRDRFVKNNGCTAQTAQEPASGSRKHIKTVYQGCSTDHPVVWIAFDDVHTPQPMDKGANQTFAPEEIWGFLSQFQS